MKIGRIEINHGVFISSVHHTIQYFPNLFSCTTNDTKVQYKERSRSQLECVRHQLQQKT